MGSTFGKNLKISIFGESHNEVMGFVLDGLKAGLKIDMEDIKNKLLLRKPDGILSTKRIENDDFKIVSGMFNGYTTGTPLTVFVKNNNINSNNYDSSILRPGHADYSAFLKYYGYQDYRGGGHFSGRITVLLVIAGAICNQILKKHNIIIASHIRNINNIYDDELTINDIQYLENKNFAVINPEKEKEMKNLIENISLEQDSVGGVIETIVYNNEGGIGEPFFNSIESVLSSLLFSIPAVKAVEFGEGTKFAFLKGSEANDSFYIDNTIKTRTNNNGGINGGITNGMPIIIKTTVKPTPSIGIIQKTINYETKQETEVSIKGRHDPCIVQRARIICDSVVAFGLLDLYLTKYGYEWMK